jgi:hypothetical protein
MRARIIVEPHLGHSGHRMALDDACVVDEGIVLSFCRRERAPLSATDARGVGFLAGDRPPCASIEQLASLFQAPLSTYHRLDRIVEARAGHRCNLGPLLTGGRVGLIEQRTGEVGSSAHGPLLKQWSYGGIILEMEPSHVPPRRILDDEASPVPTGKAR